MGTAAHGAPPFPRSPRARLVAALAALEVGAFAALADGASPSKTAPGSITDAGPDAYPLDALFADEDVLPPATDAAVPARLTCSGSSPTPSPSCDPTSAPTR